MRIFNKKQKIINTTDDRNPISKLNAGDNRKIVHRTNTSDIINITVCMIALLMLIMQSGCSRSETSEPVTKSTDVEKYGDLAKSTDVEKYVDLAPLFESIEVGGVATGFPFKAGKLSDSSYLKVRGIEIINNELAGKTYASISYWIEGNFDIMIDIDMIRGEEEEYGIDEMDDKEVWKITVSKPEKEEEVTSDIPEAATDHTSGESFDEKVVSVKEIGLGDSLEHAMEVLGEPTEYIRVADNQFQKDDPYISISYKDGEDYIFFAASDGNVINHIAICAETVRKELTK